MTGIVIDVQSRSDKAQRDLSAINDSLRNIEKSTTQVTRGFSQMVKGLGALATAGGLATYVVKVSNEFTNLENKIALVTGRTKELLSVQSKLLDLSSQNRMQISATGQIYSTLAKSMANGAASSQSILKATDSLQKAVALSGSSAESANAAIIQLGQGLASGTLRGEELNSVMEQTPRVAKAIADGIGITIGEMRTLAAEGKITSDTVFKALLSQSTTISKEFRTMAPTLEQSYTVLGNALKEFTSELDSGLGLTSYIAKNMMSIGMAVRNASLEARAFGAIFSYSFNEGLRAAQAIVNPVVDIFTTLGVQIYQALPKGFFTKTLVGDIKEGMRQIDDMTGGVFTSVSRFIQFGISDLLSYDSAVEKAIKKIRRLSPSSWLTAGFDAKTFNRFFSRETVYEYGNAFAELAVALKKNSSSIFVTIGNSFRAMSYGLKDTVRYFGLLKDTVVTFRIGNIDAFVNSFAELIRGISGAQIQIYQFGKLLDEALSPATTKLVMAIQDSILVIPEKVLGFIKEAVMLFVEALPIVSQMVKDFAFERLSLNIFDLSFVKVLRKNLNEAAEYVSFTFERILGSTTFLDKVLRKIQAFGKEVVDVFFKIYDEVVGHSWWPDTIDGVIDYTQKLLKNVKPLLDSFSDYVNRVFAEIQGNTARTLLFDVKVRLNDTADAVKLFYNEFALQFPHFAEALLKSIATIGFYLVMPMTAVTELLLASLVASTTASFAMLAEEIGSDFLKGGISKNIGEAIGTAIGWYAAEFIKNLPSLLNIILGALYGFSKAFFGELLSIIPLFGNLLSSLFKGITDFADMLGLGGPLGLIGAVLFGKGLVAINKGLALEIGWISSIGRVGERLAAFFTASANKAGTYGLIGKMLFNLGPAKILAAMGLILGSLGTFESLFGGSVIGKLATYGLLGSILLGKDPKGLVDFAYRTVIKPIQTLLNKSLVIAGPRNLGSFMLDWVTRNKTAVALMTAIMLALNSSFARAEDGVSKTTSAFDNFLASIKSIPSALLDMFSEHTLLAMLSVVTVPLATKFGKTLYTAISTALRGGAFALGAAVEGSQLLSGVVSSVGKAVSDIKNVLGVTEIFQKLGVAWDSLVIGMSMKWSKFANWFKAQWAIMMATEAMKPIKTALDALGNYIGVLQGKLSKLSLAAKTKLAGAAVVGATGLGVAAAGGGFEEIATGVLIAVSAWQVLGTAATKALSGIIAYVAPIIAGLSTIGTVALGIVGLATGGLLYTAIFGEGNTFFEKLEDTIRKLSIAIGLVDKLEPNRALNKVRENMFSGSIREFSKSKGIGNIPDFGAVDFDLISKNQKKAIDDTASKLAEALAKARDEYRIFGEIPDDLRANVDKLSDQLTKILNKAEAATTKDLPETIKNLGKISTEAGGGFGYAIERTANQFVLDFKYGWDKYLNVAAEKITEWTAPDSDELKRIRRDIANVESQKTTTYNARYKPLTTSDKALTGKLQMIEAPDMLSNVKMQKELNRAVEDYEQALKTWYTANNNYYIVGGAKARASAESNLRVAREELDLLSTQIIKYQQREFAVKKFQDTLVKVNKDLSEGGIEIDTTKLLGAGEDAFNKVKNAASAAAKYSKELKDTTVSGIADFDSASTTLKNRIEQQRIATLAAQQGYDDFFSTVTVGFANVAARIDLGLDETAIKRMSAEDAKVFRKRAHDIEELMTQLKNDKAMADIIFPEGTDKEIQRRIQESDTPALLMSYVKNLWEGLRKEVTDKMSLPDMLAQMATDTGIGFTPKDLAGYSGAGANKRFGVATQQQDLNQRVKKFQEASATNGAQGTKEYLDQMAKFGAEQRRLDKQLEYMTPRFDTASAAIERITSNANLSATAFSKLPISAKKDLETLANELLSVERKLETEAGAGAAAGWKRRGEEIKLKMQEIGNDNRKLQQTLSDVINEMQSAGFSAVTLDNIFAISPEILEDLQRAADEVYNIQQALNRPGLSMDKTIELASKMAIKKQNAIVSDIKAQQQAANANPAAQRTVSLGALAGVSIDKEQSNRLSAAMRENIDGLLQKAIDEYSKTMDPKISDDERAAAQRTLDDLRTNLNRGISMATLKREDTVAYQMGQSFATNTTDALTNGIKDLIAGRVDATTFVENMMTTFADSVINAFVEGLMNPLTGQGGVLQKAMASLGEGLFNLGSGLLGGLSSSTSTTAETATEGSSLLSKIPGLGWNISGVEGRSTPEGFVAGGASGGMCGCGMGGDLSKGAKDAGTTLTEGLKSSFDDLTTWFGELWSGIGSGFTELWDGISGGFGDIVAGVTDMLSGMGDSLDMAMEFVKAMFLADGGRVVGPGTSTSDSIPAMLSNGEFVVNARSSSKFAPLLEAINSGRISKFADGGSVGVNLSTVGNVNITPEKDNKVQSSQQVFNINVTGDISRQTRREIQQMIPTIATGVNGYNRELGRGR